MDLPERATPTRAAADGAVAQSLSARLPAETEFDIE